MRVYVIFEWIIKGECPFYRGVT